MSRSFANKGPTQGRRPLHTVQTVSIQSTQLSISSTAVGNSSYRRSGSTAAWKYNFGQNTRLIPPCNATVAYQRLIGRQQTEWLGLQ